MKKRSDQKRIVVNIHRLSPLEVSWAIIDDSNTIQNTAIRGDLSVLSEMVDDYPVYVIIPGQDVLLLQIKLPKLSRERLLQALPYALEDKLIDDVSHLHFAISDELTQGMTSVAILSKNKMDTYLEILHSFGIKPHVMIPTMLALSWEKNQWIVSCHDGISYVRTQTYNGFSCDTSNLSVFLQVLLETAEKPECVFLENVLNSSEQFALETAFFQESVLKEAMFKEPVIKDAMFKEPIIKEAMFKEPVIKDAILKESIIKELIIKDSVPKEAVFKKPVIKEIALKETLIDESILSEKDWLEKIAILWHKNQYINLLQGNYRSNLKSVKAKKIWKWASILATFWIGVLFVNQLITFFILHHAKAISEQEISLIYHQQFPTASSIVAPRERMESVLKKASANSNKNNFLTFLGVWGNTASKINEIHCLSFTYQENQLNVIVSAKSFDALDRFINDLTAQGLKVKQQNATIVDSEVKTNILVAKG